MAESTKKPRAPRISLPIEVMHELLGAGKSNVEIIRILEAEHGLPGVTQSSISHWRRRHGYAVRETPLERIKLMPWRVKTEHTGRVYTALGSEARARQGRELHRASKQGVARLRAELGQHLVVHYDQTNGFVLVPRRPGIDEDMIRDPRIADDGTRVEDEKLWQ